MPNFVGVFSIIFILVIRTPALPEKSFILAHLDGPITLDGLSDEPAWAIVEPLPLVVYQPVFGSVPTEKTEIRIAYDENFLYAAGRFYDTDPDGIRGNALERDGISYSDDGFGLVLDPFNDNENAFCLVTTPTGMRSDWTVFNDAEATGGPPWNISWNTFWDVEVIRTEEGWFAEMRIPFSSLRFQDEDGQVVMGLITWRYIARKNEIIIFPAIPPRWDLGFMKPSVAQDVVLEEVHSRNPLYITPYLLAGVEQIPRLNNSETAYDLSHTPNQELGLDLKYGLTSNLTLDLTLNTDFAQVESDDPQINITRFSLFFPEKRLFFQERASTFNFSFGGPIKLFYSRRIGLCDIGNYDYQPVPIYGGARVVGRVGIWDIGFLNMQTAQTKFVIRKDTQDSTIIVPSENFGVLRLRRQVYNPYSYVGTMLTSRIAQNGRYNYGLGVDGTIRISENDYMIFGVAQTLDSQENVSSPMDANRIRISLENRSKQGFNYNLFFARRGPHFRPRMGFELWEDYFVFARGLSYAWLSSKESPAYRQTIGIEYYFIFGNTSKNLESGKVGPFWKYEWKNGSVVQAWIKSRYEDLSDTLFLPENVFVPPNQYTFYEVAADYQLPWGQLFRSGLNVKVGPFYDGWFVTTGITPAWTLSRYISLSGNYQPTWAQFPNRNQVFNTHLIGFRMKFAVNVFLSARVFIQYNSSLNAVGINVRFRYNPQEGTDFYLVYNEGLNMNRERETPVLPLSNARTILLKYSTTYLPQLSWISW